MELNDDFMAQELPSWATATNGKRGQWDDDNSDEFMAESLAEAEAEVKDNKGEQVGLAQQIRKLEAESTVKETDEPDNFKAMKKQADAIANEALYTRSQVKFDGSAISIAENAEDAELASTEKDRKTAIKGALNDIENELHPNKPKE